MLIPSENKNFLGLHMLEIEITTGCNLHCKHCYNRGLPIQHLPVIEITKLVDFAVLQNVWTLVITGGEPLVHPEFGLIAAYLLERAPCRCGGRTVLQTNGLLLSRVEVSFLRAFDLIHISFDLTDAVRTRKDHIFSTLEFCKENDLPSYLFSTIHRDNLHLIDRMVEIAAECQTRIGFNIIQPTEESRHLGLSREEYRAALKKLLELYKRGKILRPSCPLMAIFDSSKRAVSYVGNRGGCVAGIAACAVLPNGDVIPCPFLRVKSGNIYEQPLEEIWLGAEVFNVLRDRSQYAEPCRSCENVSFCGGCRSRSYAATGELTGVDPMCFKSCILGKRIVG